MNPYIGNTANIPNHHTYLSSFNPNPYPVPSHPLPNPYTPLRTATLSYHIISHPCQTLYTSLHHPLLLSYGVIVFISTTNPYTPLHNFVSSKVVVSSARLHRVHIRPPPRVCSTSFQYSKQISPSSNHQGFEPRPRGTDFIFL